MTNEYEYISDEQLEQLIAEVEQSELIPAPPEMKDRILDGMDDRKIREFRRYCFQVITSVAAAVAVVFLLPAIRDGDTAGRREENRIEMSWELEAQMEEPDRERSDRSILAGALGGSRIFDRDDRFHIFTENGG